jgi:outer membrane protein assembly factor BamB
MPHSKVIYLGIKGSVIAMDAATGQQLWTVHLKGSGFVNVLLDGDNLYGTTMGEIFCLDPRTGDGRWHNKLTGFGYGLISVAGEGIASNQNLINVEEFNRQQEESSSSSSTSASSTTGQI